MSAASKVSVVGAGMVGASLAYSLMVERSAGEVVLVDRDKNRALGEAMDINHALPFSAPVAAGVSAPPARRYSLSRLLYRLAAAM